MTPLGSRWTRVTVRGNSMAPTLHDGQRLLARRLRRDPRRGEVIVFTVPEAMRDPADPPCRVKRITAVAGDPLPHWLASTLPGLMTVPAGHVAVAGDNPRSQDSRQLGLIACRDIIGTATRNRQRRRR